MLLGGSDGDGGASDGDGTSAVVDRPRRAGLIWKVFAEGVGSFSELSGAAITYSCGQPKPTNRLSVWEVNVSTRFFQN